MNLSEKVSYETDKICKDEMERLFKKELYDRMPEKSRLHDPLDVIDYGHKQVLKEAIKLIDRWHIIPLYYVPEKKWGSSSDIRYTIKSCNKIIWKNRIFLVTSIYFMGGDEDVIVLDTFGFFKKIISISRLPKLVNQAYANIRNYLYGSQEYVFIEISGGHYVLFKDGYLFKGHNLGYDINAISICALEDELATIISQINAGKYNISAGV